MPRGWEGHTSPQAPRMELIPGQYQGDMGGYRIPKLCPGPSDPSALPYPPTPKDCRSQRHRIREALAAGDVQQT